MSAPDPAAPLHATVVLALAQRQWVVHVLLPAGATVADAVAQSGLESRLPPQEAPPVYAVLHRRRAPQAPLRDGDRIEILRPLQVDPMTARRQRAARRAQAHAAQHKGSGQSG